MIRDINILVKLSQSIESDQLVSIDCVLLLASGKHFLDSTQGQFSLSLRNSVSRRIVEIDSWVDIFLVYLHPLIVSLHLADEIGRGSLPLDFVMG